MNLQQGRYLDINTLRLYCDIDLSRPDVCDSVEGDVDTDGRVILAPDNSGEFSLDSCHAANSCEAGHVVRSGQH